MKGSRRKHEVNDKNQEGRPSRPIKKRRGRGKQIEKERVNDETKKQPLDDIKFNRKVMNNLEKSGAVNYLLAKMFTQLSIYANQRQKKRYLIASDYKSFIKTRNNTPDNDYSDDSSNDTVQERNKIMHLIASRIVYEYLIDHRLKLATYALQNETQNDKAFSSKTPASLSPLQLKEDEDSNEDNNIIKKIILANKETGFAMKPPAKRPQDDEEIHFDVPKQKTSRLKRKNSLNSDISLNSNLIKEDDNSDSNHDYSELNQDYSEKMEDEEGGGFDLDEEKTENSEESNSQPNTPPKSPESPKKRPAPPLPSTTSPKRQKSSSIKPASPLRTTTPSKHSSNKALSSDEASEHLYSSSNIEADDDDLNSIKIYKPQSPTHAKNEINSVDLSLNSADLNFISIPNLNPIIKSTSSQNVEELPSANPNDLSKDDSLNESSSGSEHELEADDDDYFSEKDGE